VRDYGHYLSYPENHEKLTRQLGYVPTQSRLAVLIGRDNQNSQKIEVLERRRSEALDIEIITYDKILETQADQLSRIVVPDLDIPIIRIGQFERRGLSSPRKDFEPNAMHRFTT
jgi:hypothetical protein